MPVQRIKWYRPLPSVLIFLIVALSAFRSQGQNILNAHDPEVIMSKAPNWVSQQSFQVANLVDLHSPSHYHLVDKQIKGGDEKTSFSRYVYSLTDPSGIESNSNIRIRFNPAYESLRIHNISVQRRGKTVTTVKRDEIEVINVEDRQSSNIYSGEVEALVLLKDIRVGDVIDYSYSVIGNNPVFGDKFSSGATIGWSIPVDNVYFSILMPKDQPLRYKVFNSPVKMRVSSEGEFNHYQLNVINSPEIYEEDQLPSWYNPYPYVQVSEYSSWQEVANWANQLFDVDHQPSDELAEFIAELKTKPQLAAINEAINFTQNQVRYLGLELGENSHRPHSPSETFNHRQGDCKDKSLLLSVLLKQLGIEAYPALVSTIKRDHLNDYLPTHSMFDHAIVQLTYNDTPYWIDPTITHQGAQLTSKYQADYGLALIVSNQTHDLSSAKPSSNLTSDINVVENIIAADYRSPVEWTIRTTMSGREAEQLRYRIKSEGKTNLAKSYINYYAKRFPKIEALETIVISDDLASNQLTLIERYLVPDFWEIDEQLSAKFSLHADYPNQYVSMPKSIKREQPLAIFESINIDHKVTLQFPEDIDFSAEVEDEIFDDAQIKFASKIAYDQRLLSFHNILNAQQGYVDVDNVAEHLALLDSISNRMNYYNSITNTTDDPGLNEMANLLNSLNKHRLSHAFKQGE